MSSEIFDDVSDISVPEPLYKIIKQISSGNSGILFLAEDIKTKMKVIIKCFNKKNGRTYFNNESRILKYISEHCKHECLKYYGYISIFDIDTDLSKYNLYYKCLVLQYLDENDGWVSTAQIIINNIKINKEEVIQNIRNEVTHLHDKLGIVHNDLTPYNIMINVKTSKVMLIDYGESCFIKDDDCSLRKGFFGMISDIINNESITYVSTDKYGPSKTFPNKEKDLHTLNVVCDLIMKYAQDI